MQKSHTWSVTISVLMILAGLLAVIAPAVAGIAATLLIGWLLLICGGFHLVFSWHRQGAGGTLWEVLVGLLYIAIGLYLVANPLAGLASITLGIAFYLLIEAVLEFTLAAKMRGTRGTGWLWLDGIVNVILTFVIWRTWPASSVWLIGTLIGIGIIFTGFVRLMLTMGAQRLTAPPATL